MAEKFINKDAKNGNFNNQMKYCKKSIVDWVNFWSNHPAFHFGIHALIGTFFFFFSNPLLIGLWFSLLLLFLSAKRNALFFGALLSAISLFIFCSVSKDIPSLPKGGVNGEVILKIESVNESKNYFGEGYLLKGTLVNFLSSDGKIKAQNLPCTLYLKKSWNLPDPSYTYLINGKIIDKGFGLNLKVNPKNNWKQLKRHISFAKWRSNFKRNSALWIRNKFQNKEAGDFITGLSLGMIDSLALKKDLNQLGLQHILAISGFHFSLLGAFFLTIFNFIFSKRWAIFFTLAVITGYFFILGYSPSIFRAWVMSTIYLMSIIFTKKNSSLNNLGVALFLNLIIEPCDLLQIGFQFSYLATFALITLSSFFEKIFKGIFSNRELSQVIMLKISSQIGHMILSFSRKSLALSFSVHLLTLPIILFLFHQFPLGSLFYNLFYPFLITFSLILLILGIISTPFGFFSNLIFSINNGYTSLLIELCKNPLISGYITVESVSIELIIVLLVLIISLVPLFNRIKKPEFFV